ncbi:TPA: hypothetical protein EYP38_01165 [Candidatus Micrarchaeota archaeon]|nr:hypothetical protein [Candidatus Micrarchaeota archaeon]
MQTHEPLIEKLQVIIHWSVRVLAILMVFVIVMGVVDVAWTLYQKVLRPPSYILTITDILATFGAFMAVLIAIEIFVNITVYLREDVIHVKIVMATALMAIARKVIILDLDKLEPEYLWGIASVVLAISIGYWLVVRLPRFDLELGPHRYAQKDDTTRQNEGMQSTSNDKTTLPPEDR